MYTEGEKEEEREREKEVAIKPHCDVNIETPGRRQALLLLIASRFAYTLFHSRAQTRYGRVRRERGEEAGKREDEARRIDHV